jgi:xylulose-5-phosphate/fructose-6-phosphate phosphoketolase
MNTKILSPELLHNMDAYWRAANYLSVGQIYLYDNPLLKRPLTLADVKHMLLGHWARPRAEFHLRPPEPRHQKI